MKKYHVATTGYDGYTTMTETELKEYIRDEVKRARRYFGTAVCHRSVNDDKTTLWFEITARQDKHSTRWALITAHKH